MNHYSIFSDEAIRFYPYLVKKLDLYELKVLIFLYLNASDDGIYIGNLKNICDFLHISSNSTNNTKIKNAINSLTERQLIESWVEKKKWMLTLKEESMKGDYCYIKRQWIEEIMNFNRASDYSKIDPDFSISWINIFRVFAFTFFYKAGEIVKCKFIASDLNLSKSTVSSAFNALVQCSFDGMIFQKEVIKSHYDEKILGDGVSGICRTYKTKGSLINFSIDFSSIIIPEDFQLEGLEQKRNRNNSTRLKNTRYKFKQLRTKQ